MRERKTGGSISRRAAIGTLAAGATGLMTAPSVKAAEPLKITFATQHGLLYLPVDTMVSGGVLQKEADKAGLGKLDMAVKALGGPGDVNDALLSGAADYGTISLVTFLTLWEKTRGTPNEMRALGTMANGAMTLYSINPNVKTIADFTDKDRIAVPTVKLSFNSMVLQVAAEKMWNDPLRLVPLEVPLSHPDAVAALSAGYGKSTITAHVAIQPFTERGLKIPGAHVVTDSLKEFGGPLTQILLVCSKKTKDQNPALFKTVGAALEESIKVANADKKASAELWKQAQNASDKVEDIVTLISDPGFEFTSKPQRVVQFSAFLNRMGRLKAKVENWKDIFWDTAYAQEGS